MPSRGYYEFRENLLLALDTLRTHKFRAFLTILGVLIGTTTVICVASIFNGLDHQLVDLAESFEPAPSSSISLTRGKLAP